MDVGILTLACTVAIGLFAGALAWPNTRLARLQLADREREGLPMHVRLAGVLRVYVGAVLIIVGIAGFIETHSHHPVSAVGVPGDAFEKARLATRGVAPIPASGLPPTAYDLLRIGAWALIVLGVVTVILGLICFSRKATPGNRIDVGAKRA
jgi:uncharacterized membrane protein